jgi:hypothetical protein
MPKFYASSPYFDSSAAKFLNRNHIFSWFYLFNWLIYYWA